MKAMAAATLNQIFWIIYRICRAYVVWYEMDD